MPSKYRKNAWMKKSGPKGRRNPYSLKGTLPRASGIPHPSRAIATRSTFRYSHCRLSAQTSIRMDAFTGYSFLRRPDSATRWSSLAGNWDSFKVNAMRVKVQYPNSYFGGTYVDSGLVNPVQIVDYPTSAVFGYDNDQITNPSSFANGVSYDNSQIVPTHGLQSYEVGLKQLKAQVSVSGTGLENFVESEWMDVASVTGMEGCIFLIHNRVAAYNNGLNQPPDAINTAIITVEWDCSFRSRL